ncbi:unnamed protein product, partial [Ilex paraguariensis]
MIGEAFTSKDPKKIDGAPTCSANYQTINESGSTQSLTKTSLGSAQKDTPPNPPSLPNEVIANKTPSATSTTVDVEIKDHRGIQVTMFGTLPYRQHPSKHLSVPQTKPTPEKPWSQVLKQNAMEKSSSLQQHPSESSKRLVRLKQRKLIGGYQASSSVTIKNNMGMVIQGGASNSSQQDILGHDHHITKITVNESTPPQLLMQVGVILASNKFEELTKRGQIVVDLRVKIELENK